VLVAGLRLAYTPELKSTLNLTLHPKRHVQVAELLVDSEQKVVNEELSISGGTSRMHPWNEANLTLHHKRHGTCRWRDLFTHAPLD
jgi:hypothetical protein